MQLSKRDVTDLLRSVGGVLFAVGAVVLLVRKSGHHEWSDFELLLVVLVPAVVLYVLALGVLERPRSEGGRPWQSVLMIVAILLGPVVLFEFLQWIGASTRHVLYDAGVFALTGLLAAYAARRARVSYAALLAGLSLLVAWLLVWGKILDHPSADTYRWLLVAAAVLLLAVAARLARTSAIGAGEVATAGGIAAVSAGVLGVIVGSFVGVFRSFTTSIEGTSSIGGSASIPSGQHIAHVFSSSHISSRPHIFPHPLLPHVSGLQHFGWDLYLLVVSLALVWIGSRMRVRGLGYVGGVGLLAFLVSISAQITRLEAGRTPTFGIVGWPLALLIIGVVGLAAPMLYRRES
jgi:hypothetical protein